MTSKTRASSTPRGPYILELDADLLAEAVAAVESHRNKREVPVDEFEVEIPVPEVDPATIPVRDHGQSETVEEESTAEPGLDLATMAAEWTRVSAELDRLQAELVKMRLERDVAVQRAENESRERVRLLARVKRLGDAGQESIQVASAAREGQRQAEALAATARETVQRSEEATTRMRERLRRQEEEQRLFGHTAVVVELLPVLENLERANLTRDASLVTLRGGVQIVHDQFRAALTRVGVARIEASRGTQFQPAIHEAVIHVAVADAVPGTVVAELQPGYMLNGRLLRPARVSVAAAAGAQPYEEPPPVAPLRPSLSEGDALALPDDSSFETEDGAEDDEDDS